MKKKVIIAVSICIPVLAVVAFLIAVPLSIILDKTDYHWEFEQSHTEVKAIMIIDIDDAAYGSKWQDYNSKILLEMDISQAETVFQDVQNLDMHRYGTNLIDQYGVGILIVFNNDDYDLITCWEPEHHRYNAKYDRISGYTSWLYCDETQFDALISKYLEK